MLIYLDSSALVKRSIEEAESDVEADMLVTYDDQMISVAEELGVRTFAPA